MTAVFAHRGATASARENTLEAFAEARARGADGVELDVRRSRDGALVVHHDEWVEGAGLIAALDVADLPGYVPLLAEVVEVCGPMMVNIELKNDPGEQGFDPSEATAVAVAHLLAESGWWERVVVSSFRSASIDALRAVDDRPPIGWLLGLMADAPAALDEAIDRGYDALHPFVTQVSPELVERAHVAGISLAVWTVNAPHDIEHLAALGVDTIITDTPAEALAIVGRAPLG